MNKNTLLFVLMAPLLGIFLTLTFVYYALNIWSSPSEIKEFTINPGETFPTINGKLAQNHLVFSARLFHRYCQYKGALNKFKPGRYTLPPHPHLFELYKALVEGKPLDAYFTVPEGKNMYEIADLLERAHITSKEEFLSLAKSPQFLKKEGIMADTVEGHLFPDTYNFFPDTPAETVMKTMIREFRLRTKNLDLKSNPLGLSALEALTLASMVEKETGEKSERPAIAGVFYNRLKIHMRLQSDPTTIYGMFERYTGNITKKDLLTPTDYNTYTIPAIPKGPISNPGLASLKAILHPAQHKFLYFVSKNNGTHIFTENYKDHLSAVREWQMDSKKREGHSWRELGNAK